MKFIALKRSGRRPHRDLRHQRGRRVRAYSRLRQIGSTRRHRLLPVPRALSGSIPPILASSQARQRCCCHPTPPYRPIGVQADLLLDQFGRSNSYRQPRSSQISLFDAVLNFETFYCLQCAMHALGLFPDPGMFRSREYNCEYFGCQVMSVFLSGSA
jgi:hypothetical protein